ncbi:response regulator transcription factor [Sphingomonas echinoides]|uniref:response regulator transcription factor n=1 Tax=Sphingomonas echinoides TaxID=59803 RepID=UPI00241327E8|nr:response regulator transcription factor [Sphingomonas echinoides]
MGRIVSIAIVEEDDDLRSVFTRYLTQAGMDVFGYRTIGALEDYWANATGPDILVLDVDLPRENGFIATARIRARSMVGIIMVTRRTEHEDRLLGLSMGADHYLAKPIDLRELESIIRNLARRLFERRETGANAIPEQPIWTLRRDEWRLIAPNGAVVDLSAAEHQLLTSILEQPGRANSRDSINAKLGKPMLDAQNRSLDVLMSRVRRKIEAATGLALPLRAARGTGYVFTGQARIEGPPEA